MPLQSFFKLVYELAYAVLGPLLASFNGGFLEGLEHTINYSALYNQHTKHL